MSDEMTPRDSATLACADGVTPERLSAWRDGLLPADQSAWLVAHSAGCPACAARLRDYDQIGAALRGQVIPRPDADPWPAMRLRLTRERRRGLRLASAPRWGGVGALIAAALLVALFAGLLAQQAARRPMPASTATLTKATSTPSAPLAAWTQVPGYKDLYGLAVAPSDPRVAYQVWLDSNGNVIARRTQNQGATWQALTLPNIPHAKYPLFGLAFTAWVSPADARVVYLKFEAQTNTGVSTCGYAGLPLDGTVGPPMCMFQFISTDGGAHWQALSLPTEGSFGPNPALQADSTTHAILVYDTIGSLQSGSGSSLVRSDDDGVSWRPIDGPISGTGQKLVAYAATSIGSIVFALSEPANSPVASHPPLTLWRSDDAGATWTNLGPAPNNPILYMTAARVANSGKPILYLLTTDNRSNEYIEGSLYGASGSFHLAPDPAPRCQPSGNSYLLGSLADGSVLAWCGGEIEAWLTLPARADQGWRPVAANPGVNTIQSAFTQTLPDGTTRLWLVISDNTGARVEYASLKP